MSNISYIFREDSRTIEVFDDHITVTCNPYVYETIKLSRNVSHVLKFNKTSISTCNVEFLIAAIETSGYLFNVIYTYCANNEIIASLKAFNKIWSVTRAGFYGLYNDDNDALIAMFKGLSHNARQQVLADHICYNHDAKMQGVISMSTYVGANKFCQARCNNCNGAICQYCYADSLTAQRANLKNKLARLHAILTNIELSIADIPILDVTIFPYFRFEAFGDLNNTIQINNYNLFASCNPDINFTLWTKNPGIIQRAINQGMTLANNLVIGLSSLYLNTPEFDKARKYPFIRFLFTVYDDDYIREHNIIINCGAKHCLSCGICYKYLHEFRHGLQLINERKK